MDWDDLVRRWRRESKAESRGLLIGADGHATALPAPRRRRRSRWLILLLALVAAGVLLLYGTGSGSGPNAATNTLLSASIPGWLDP